MFVSLFAYISEGSWSRTEGRKDCGGPQFLEVFVMHHILHFKYLDFFQRFWAPLRRGETEIDQIYWNSLKIEGTCWPWSVLLLRDPVTLCFLPASVPQLRLRNSPSLIYYNTDLTNHWYLRFKEMFCLFFLFSFSFFFLPFASINLACALHGMALHS